MSPTHNNTFDLTFTQYEITLKVEAPLRLPDYKGATLRGCFGETLKRLCCPHHPATTCDAKPPACQCPYGFLFAPQTPGGTRFRAGEEVARPFVIEPPLDAKREYRSGESVNFNLILFGKANLHLPYFLVTFRQLPPLGISPYRGRVALHEVWAVNDLSGVKQRVYSAADGLVRNVEQVMSLAQLAATASHYPHHRLTLHFQTNTILRYLSHKEGVRRIEFHVLISRLLQRVETLSVLYGEQDAASSSDTARQLINAAKSIAIVHDDTRWNAWKRYAAYQRREVPMDGVIGRVTYAGDLRPFLRLLLLGQYTHVGKGCVFGLGKYTVLR